MVEIPDIREIREIKLNKNKQIDEETLKREGWVLCGIKCIKKDTIVVFERARKDDN